MHRVGEVALEETACELAAVGMHRHQQAVEHHEAHRPGADAAKARQRMHAARAGVVGHRVAGWRGLTAVRWTTGSFVLLVVAFFGTKFVLEMVLQRG